VFCFNVETELNYRKTVRILILLGFEHSVPNSSASVVVSVFIHSKSLGAGKGHELGVRSGPLSFIIEYVEVVVFIKRDEISPGVAFAVIHWVVEAPLQSDKLGCHLDQTEKGLGSLGNAANVNGGCDSCLWAPPDRVSSCTSDVNGLSHLHSVTSSQGVMRNEARHL